MTTIQLGVCGFNTKSANDFHLYQWMYSALRDENYEACQVIKQELENRGQWQRLSKLLTNQD